MKGFLSSIYLEMYHGSRELPSWRQLTTGVPAVLSSSNAERKISLSIAQMQGLETGCMAPSTLHIYYDLYKMLSSNNCIVFRDNLSYPVSGYGIEQILSVKKPVILFQHQNADDLKQKMELNLIPNYIPVIITDGWCTGCGKPAPIARYLNIVAPYRGIVIIDDTQAFGILGERKKTGTPLGTGGGGLLKWLGINSRNIVSVTSLAKGFGVPTAVISGSDALIGKFVNHSLTRVHSSPVNTLSIIAARHAILLNHTDGDQRRTKLWQNIARLKELMGYQNIILKGDIFPVQSISCMPQIDLPGLYKYLRNKDIACLLLSSHLNSLPELSFIITSGHSFDDIDRLAEEIFRFQKRNTNFLFHETPYHCNYANKDVYLGLHQIL